MEVSASLLARLNTPAIAFTDLSSVVEEFVEPTISWDESALNPKNLVESLRYQATTNWSIGGSARFGTQLLTIPTLFLPSLHPLRIDTYIPEQSQHPPSLSQSLNSHDAVVLRDSRSARLALSLHIIHALNHWSSLQPEFGATFTNLPFGSRIVIKNIHQDVTKMDIAIYPDYEVERQLLSLKALQAMWHLPESALPEILDLSSLHLRQQPHESISLVTIPSRHSSELFVFKSSTDDVKHLYHELKIRLTLPPHDLISAKPLYLITKKCLFGGKKGIAGFIMPYCPRGSLRHALPVMRTHQTLALTTQFTWALQLVSALTHLNTTAQIFYPDLRPENILITPSNDLLLIDFEQRGGWHPCGPPEICYLKYLQTLATTSSQYESLLLQHASSTLLSSTRNHRYANPPAGYALPWLLLTPREREAAQVYMLGLLLWCTFEGQSEVVNDLFTALPYQPHEEFPTFRHTPAAVRRCIRECTQGAPGWERKGCWGVGWWGTRVFARQRGDETGAGAGEEDGGTARKIFEASREWWVGQVERMEEYLKFRKVGGRTEEGSGGNADGRRKLVDPSGNDRRPSLSEVAEMLREARKESLTMEDEED